MSFRGRRRVIHASKRPHQRRTQSLLLLYILVPFVVHMWVHRTANTAAVTHGNGWAVIQSPELRDIVACRTVLL